MNMNKNLSELNRIKIEIFAVRYSIFTWGVIVGVGIGLVLSYV